MRATRLVLFVCASWSAVIGQCVIPKAWPLYSEGAKQLCGDRNTTADPDFDSPIACSSKTIIPNLAFSIANQAFLCDSWCIFDAKNTSLAWGWTGDGRCWREDPGCLALEDDRVHAMTVHSHLCLECSPLIPPSSLRLETQRARCTSLSDVSNPGYHRALVCESKQDDQDLALSLLNGGFADCTKWCVYSIRTPDHLAWKWNAQSKCWARTGHTCLLNSAELMLARTQRGHLCEAPCKDPISEKDLSVDLIRKTCPQYQPTGMPQFHHGRLCRQSNEDPELRLALANNGFSKCSAWCVFSVLEPSRRAWRWTVDGCWIADDSCLLKTEEMQAVASARTSLCQRPAVDAKPAQQAVSDKDTIRKAPQEKIQIRAAPQADPEGGHWTLLLMLALAGVSVLTVLYTDH